MTTALLDDTEALKRMPVRSQAELLKARLMVEKLKLEILRFKRAKFGASSERLTELAQLELLVEELESEQASLNVGGLVDALDEPDASDFPEGEPAQTGAGAPHAKSLRGSKPHSAGL